MIHKNSILINDLVSAWLDSQVHRSMGSLETHQFNPTAQLSYGEFNNIEALTAQWADQNVDLQLPAAGFWPWVSSPPQPLTRSLCWLATWTISTIRSCVLPSLTSTSWPIYSGRWTSRWFPWLTSTARRCTVLWQNSSCCSTREFMVCPPWRSRRWRALALCLHAPVKKVLWDLFGRVSSLKERTKSG